MDVQNLKKSSEHLANVNVSLKKNLRMETVFS